MELFMSEIDTLFTAVNIKMWPIIIDIYLYVSIIMVILIPRINHPGAGCYI